MQGGDSKPNAHATPARSYSSGLRLQFAEWSRVVLQNVSMYWKTLRSVCPRLSNTSPRRLTPGLSPGSTTRARSPRALPARLAAGELGSLASPAATALERGVPSLHRGVVVAVSAPAVAGSSVGGLERFLVVVAEERAAPNRVVDPTRCRLPTHQSGM